MQLSEQLPEPEALVGEEEGLFDKLSPSIQQIKTLIKQETIVEIKLVTDETLTGKIVWHDEQCLGMNDFIVIPWQAIAYLKRH